MASRNLIILLASVAVLFPATATATKYWVGDDKGWTIDYDYQAWAKDKVFRIGDILVFKYSEGQDSVYKVNQTEFQNCIVPGGEGFRTGHDEIPLQRTGKQWYISGAPKHCSEHKQQLAMNAIKSGAPAPVPMAPMTPPISVGTPQAPSNSAYGVQQASQYQVLLAATVAFAAFLMA